MLDEEEGVKTENFGKVGGWGGDRNRKWKWWSERKDKLVWAVLMRLWDI